MCTNRKEGGCGGCSGCGCGHRHSLVGKGGVIDKSDPRYRLIMRRRMQTYAYSALAYIVMGLLVVGALAVVNAHWGFHLGWGVIWLLLPLVGWFFSGNLALAMSRSRPANADDPTEAHMIEIITRAFQKTGMKHMPKIYCSPDEGPNAFATGRNHRHAVVAFTTGLLKVGFTDEEIEAIFDHEFGHVYNYDVAINSFFAILTSLLPMIIDAGVRAWLKGLAGAKRRIGMRAEQRILPAFVVTIVSYAVYWLVGQFTQLLQMFLVRSRESGADACGAFFGGNPCALSMALQKLGRWVEQNRPKPGTREHLVAHILRPITIVDCLFDEGQRPAKATGGWGRVKAVWRYLHLSHPPIAERCDALDAMNGKPCERLPEFK